MIDPLLFLALVATLALVAIMLILAQLAIRLHETNELLKHLRLTLAEHHHLSGVLTQSAERVASAIDNWNETYSHWKRG